MNVKIFKKSQTHIDELREKGFENLINEFCDSVDVIDIVVLSSEEIVVKYEK